MSWKEKRLITILSIILAVLCAAVLVVLSIRYRAAQAAKDQNTVSPSDIAEAAQSEYVALSYSNGSTTLSFSLNGTASGPGTVSRTSRWTIPTSSPF